LRRRHGEKEHENDGSGHVYRPHALTQYTMPTEH
jgi:hypothetical protein